MDKFNDLWWEQHIPKEIQDECLTKLRRAKKDDFKNSVKLSLYIHFNSDRKTLTSQETQAVR